jgi:hypothetical protein
MTRSIVFPASVAMFLVILLGCAADRDQIPPNATPVSSGNGQVTYTATTPGTVWVYDAGSDRIVYSGPLGMNQVISIDPQANQVTIDGRIVFDKGLHSNLHKIFFLASAQGSVQ